MPATTAVHVAFDRFGRDAGMELHRRAWYRRSAEVIAVSDLQKSQYGAQYYFNQGFWLCDLGDERYPKGSSSHVHLRLETLVPEQRHLIARLLDLEQEIPDVQRIDGLIALLNARMLPVIEQGASLAGLRAMVEDGTLASAAIRGPAQRALGLAG